MTLSDNRKNTILKQHIFGSGYILLWTMTCNLHIYRKKTGKKKSTFSVKTNHLYLRSDQATQ